MWEQFMQMLQGLSQGSTGMPGMGGGQITPWTMPAMPKPLPPAAIAPPRPIVPAATVPVAAKPVANPIPFQQMTYGGGGGSGQERNNGMNAGYYQPRLGNLMAPKGGGSK